MSWHFVYQKLKGVLDDPEFKKRNLHENPHTPEDAVLISLYHLNKEYSEKATETCRKEFGV